MICMLVLKSHKTNRLTHKVTAAPVESMNVHVLSMLRSAPRAVPFLL